MAFERQDHSHLSHYSPPDVLIVDDKRENLFAFQATLRSEDYRIFTAGSGREALKLLLAHEFAVAVLDVQMPDMDGYEIAKLIRQRESSRKMPIVFITAVHQEPRQILHGYEVGAVDYLLKPVDPLILRSKVRVFVELYRKNEELLRQAMLLRECESRDLERLLAKLEAQDLRRYKILADSIPHLVWRTDLEGSVEYVNQVWSEYTGLAAERSMEHGWQTAVHPQDLPGLKGSWQFARKRNLDRFELECRIRDARSGDFRWHLVRGSAEKNESGFVVGWVVTHTDIHAHRGTHSNEALSA